MFLKRVYRYNKWLFAGMLFFVTMQLFVFSRRGMVFSPWFNYGMYSAVTRPQASYVVYKVYADGKLMKGDAYSPKQWDAIQFSLAQADATECNAHFYETQISRLFRKFHLPVPAKEHYVNTLFDAREIRALISSHIASRLHAKKVVIIPVAYEWNGSKLVEKNAISNFQSNSFQCN